MLIHFLLARPKKKSGCSPQIAPPPHLATLAALATLSLFQFLPPLPSPVSTRTRYFSITPGACLSVSGVCKTRYTPLIYELPPERGEKSHFFLLCVGFFWTVKKLKLFFSSGKWCSSHKSIEMETPKWRWTLMRCFWRGGGGPDQPSSIISVL